MESKKSYNQNDKNDVEVFCKYCSSKIIAKQMAYFVNDKDLEIPTVELKRRSELNNDSNENIIQPKELIQEFWCIENMFNFENIGFTNTVDNIKYLSCADCDIGPIGYHDLNTKVSYVALSRISNKAEQKKDKKIFDATPKENKSTKDTKEEVSNKETSS